jgi:hypothetical protein
MEQTNDKNEQIIKDLAEIKRLISTMGVTNKWINKELACSFFDYGNTQISTLLKDGKLVCSRIGRRTFISIKSLENFLENNIQKPEQ